MKTTNGKNGSSHNGNGHTKTNSAGMTAGKVLLVFTIGMATGAVLGVLFAPDKGSNTRKKLSKKGSQYVGTLKDTASEYVDTLEEGYESVKETAGGIAHRVKGAVHSLAHDGQKHTRKA